MCVFGVVSGREFGLEDTFVSLVCLDVEISEHFWQWEGFSESVAAAVSSLPHGREKMK